jgi:hypothetical protein
VTLPRTAVGAAALVSVNNRTVSSTTMPQCRRNDKSHPQNDTSSNKDAQLSPTLATSFEAVCLEQINKQDPCMLLYYFIEETGTYPIAFQGP